MFIPARLLLGTTKCILNKPCILTASKKSQWIQINFYTESCRMYRSLSQRTKFSQLCSLTPTLCGEIRPLDYTGTPQKLDDLLFDILSEDGEKISIGKFKESLFSMGIRPTDARLVNAFNNLAKMKTSSDDKYSKDIQLDKQSFIECVSESMGLISKAFKNQLIIPDWATFCQQIESMYDRAKENNSGQIATYIPQLARADPSHWAVSICTIDGQRYSIGNTSEQFCIQSMGKPFIYALTLDELGTEKVHQYVGHEPSGKTFNYISLNDEKKPHNALINSGSIIVCSLIKPDSTSADRFDYVESSFEIMAGKEHIGFNNATFLSEKATADRNFALAYYMKENKCFPDGINMMEVLDLYFQICSIEITTDSGSVMAATLANGGICPTTGQRVFSPATVRDTLSVMYSCGMYDYSGRFAFSVGIPAKSGVSGGIVISIPNVMGICVYSPLLDQYGNSVRGVQFSEDLVSLYNFHNFDNLVYTAKKLDPRKQKYTSQTREIVTLMYGAYNGDVTALTRLLLAGVDMNQVDYDGRTALHIAAAEGQLQAVKFLLDKCNASPYTKDRWSILPIHDAQQFGHNKVVNLLNGYMSEPVADEAENIL